MAGLFITFEGSEGSGKTTHARLLYEHLSEKSYPVVLTREPGGTQISDKVRELLLDPNNTDILPATEILLFSAARAQLSEESIRPHLEQGHIVICDRYADSTMAYQGYGLGLDLETLRAITAFATGGLTPDLTLYLDVPVEAGLKRRLGLAGDGGLVSRGTQLPLFDKWDRLDMMELDFHRRVQQGYEQLIQADPDRWHRVDATPPLEEVQENIRSGIVDVGYTREMVVMALGEPDEKLAEKPEEEVAEVWIYRKSTPGFGIGVGTGGYAGSGVSVGTGVRVGEPARSKDRAWVEFSGGRVKRIRTPESD